MDFTRADMTNTTHTVKLLLSDIGLDEYRFALEPRGAQTQVRIEYAATDGWRSTSFVVDDTALSASRRDRRAREALAREWCDRLVRAKRRANVAEDLRAEAIALGRAWAEQKAEALRETQPSADWPDFWDDADAGALPVDLEASRLDEMRAAATRAARERWREIVREQRERYSAGDDDDRELVGATVRPGP